MISREEFAIRRDADLLSAEARLKPAVEAALERYGKREAWFAPILTVVQRLWREYYANERSERPIKSVRSRFDEFTKSVRDSLAKTTEPSAQSVDTITRWLATSIVNNATLAAHESPDDVLEWVTMHDASVRQTHRDVDGDRRRPGEPFTVAGEELLYPGQPIGDPSVWINCRCVLRPISLEAALTAAADSPEGNKPRPSVVVALPHEDDPVHGLGPEQSHMTLAYLGDSESLDGDAAAQAVGEVAKKALPFTDTVSGRGELGPDKANVLLLDGAGANAAREALLEHPTLQEAHAKAPQHPNFIPHVTLGYPGDGEISQEQPESIHFDRLALWHGDQQTEYPLGGDSMTAAATGEAPAVPNFTGQIPWYGILAPEGVPSGDKRQFAAGSLRNRDLPLPLTWQKTGADGHTGHVVVAKIDKLWRDEEMGVIKAQGTFLGNDSADEVIGQIAEFGRFGVSVDVDDATFDLDENAETVTFSDARICSACIVAIPAFAEAFVALGQWDEELAKKPLEGSPAEEELETPKQEIAEGDDAEEQDGEPDPTRKEKKRRMAGASDEFGRGPGWVTNPVATKRIHDYWTVPGQPGYEKVAWGTGGDFNRCRIEVGEEVGENSPEKLRFINAQCAQWHHDALGYWPSTHKKMLGGHAADAVSLVASSSPRWTPPGEWFSNPNLDHPVNVPQVQEFPEGKRVFGHIAWWKSCHVGFAGVCVAPPSSSTDYSFFLTNSRLTSMGEVAVGVLSLGGGHADDRLGMRAAIAHYDNVATAVCEVNVGEDEHGIWYSGWVLPTVGEDVVEQFRARPLSGDWRECAQTGGLELIAACSVNNPGFIRPRVSFANGKQVSLVAAGVPNEEIQTYGVSDVVREVRAQMAREERMNALRLEWRKKYLAELAGTITEA